MPRKAKRKLEVRAQITNVELVRAKSALTLEIFASNEKLGALEIGRGSMFWTGANRQRSKRIDWSRSAAMMDRLAYGAS